VTVVEAEVELAVPAERAWRVVADPTNLPSWDRRIVGVEDVPISGLARGARYTVVLRLVAVRARVACHVLEWEPPGRSVVELSGLVDATVTSTVTPLGPDRCVLFHHVDYRFRGGSLGELGARSVRILGGADLALRHGMRAQRRQIEEA
jgi:uncharacterized protein YndB with AHSA1/START domain